MIVFMTFYQTDLPKLVEPPKITNNICGDLTVTWNGWVKDTDIGEGPIARYLYVYSFLCITICHRKALQ